jgi:glycosyltransferase involved in cell wall biosynthesis
LKKILIFSPYFTPAFKGGGPIQSLHNLVGIVKGEFELSIFCSATDLGENLPMGTIVPDQWSDFSIGVRVFYAHRSVSKSVNWVLNSCRPDFIYINGFFSIPYNLLPLWLAKSKRYKIIFAPRGMLQKGALSIKPLKKRLLLHLFRLTDFHKRIKWHATDDQEKIDIKEIFGSESEVIVASNIPKLFWPFINDKEKSKGDLRIVFLSLITKKKNLHLILEALKLVTIPVSFHIYGPVKDKDYWEKCSALMTGQIHKIEYLGAVYPAEVQNLISRYHVMILPTKGENFGHAIYESLSVGTPVIVSQHTPWGHLQSYDAGITVETMDPIDWAKGIQMFIDLDRIEYLKYVKGAHDLAKDYFSKNNFKSQYQNLFS